MILMKPVILLSQKITLFLDCGTKRKERVKKSSINIHFITVARNKIRVRETWPLFYCSCEFTSFI